MSQGLSQLYHLLYAVVIIYECTNMSFVILLNQLLMKLSQMLVILNVYIKPINILYIPRYNFFYYYEMVLPVVTQTCAVPT